MIGPMIVCKNEPGGYLLPAIQQNKTPTINYLHMLDQDITNASLKKIP